MADDKEEVDGLDLMDDPLVSFAATNSDNELDDNEDVVDNLKASPFPGDDHDDDEGHLTDEHSGSLSPPHSEEIDEPSPVKKAPSSPKQKRKRPVNTLRKNPDAPRRFKSSYICFFTAKQGEIKESLGGKATVKEISQEAAQLWKHMDAEERAKWDEIAAKDKERYMKEKASYTGPWQVPNKRPKKDPSAPKRPMSAFLLFSQGRRAQVRKEHPDIKNTEVSRLLGEMWRACTDEQKKPFQEQEMALREKYKVEMEGWKEKAGERKEAEMKRKNEEMERQRQQYEYAVHIAQQTPQLQQQQANYYGQSAGYSNYQMYPQGHPAMYQQAGYPAQYAFSQPDGFQYQMAGKQQPVVLASNGMPYYLPGQQQTQRQADGRTSKTQYSQSFQPQDVTATAPAPFDASFGSGYLELGS